MVRRLIALFIGWVAVGAVGAEMLDGVKGRHGVAMHGDVAYPAGFTHFRYVNRDAPKGGRLHLGARGTYDNLNGYIAKGTTPSGLPLTYNTLASAPADEAFTYYGELAELIFMPDDRSWVAFKLRGEATWHDGKPITTDDVIWTFNTLVAKGLPFFRYYYGNVAKVLKVGDDIVRFNFSEGENQELPLILGQLPVLPKHYWEAREWDITTLEPPLGSGPYRIGAFEAGRSFTLERVNKAPASFDPVKLQAFQGNWFESFDVKKKVALCLPYLQQAGLVESPPDCGVAGRLTAILAAAGDRVKMAGDILRFVDFFVADDVLVYEEKAFA